MLRQGLKTLMDLPDASGADALLSGLGISAAVVSASFAGYMVLTSPDLALPRAQLADPIVSSGQNVQTRAIGRDTLARAGRATAAGDPDIDFTPTGTVVPDDAEAQRGDDASETASTSLQDFSVREVFDGTALVEARGSLELVKPGTMIAGAGKVLSIEQRGSSLIVVTTGGVIRRRP